MSKPNPSQSWVSRSIGFTATIVLLFAIIAPPFVGTARLVDKMYPYLTGVPQEIASTQLPSLTRLVSLSGFLFLLIGVLLGLLFFGLRFHAGKARVGMVLCAAGLLLITVTLFNFGGDVISKVFAVVQVGAWPSLGFFGTGYFIAWIAILAGLLSTRTRAKQLQPQLQVAQPIPRKQTLQPQALESTIPTGYLSLDNILYGGLPLGSSIVLTGPPCDEKNLILTRFLETSLASGRRCIFVSTSLDRVRSLLGRFSQSLYVIICNPQADTIASAHPDVVRLNTVDSLTALNLEYDKATAKMQSKEPAVLCLEVLDDVLLTHHGASRRWLMDILGRNKANQITCLATFNPAMHPAEESQAVLETFDGHIDLYEAEIQVRPKLIRIKKLGGRKFLDSEIRVEKDKI